MMMSLFTIGSRELRVRLAWSVLPVSLLHRHLN